MRVCSIAILSSFFLFLFFSPYSALAIDQFEAHAVFVAGSYWNCSLMALRVVDVNADGYPDVVGAISLGYSISVMLGDGNGMFGPPVHYPEVDIHARDISVADLDGDGHQDIAVACLRDPVLDRRAPDGCVAILFGRGDGTFRDPVFSEAGEGPAAIRAGDLDGDGDQDLVVANGESDDVAVLENIGKGQFQVAHCYPVGSDPTTLELGDLDGDGNPDLVIVSGEDDMMTIFLGTGKGSFVGGGRHETGEYPRGIELADLNHDSLPDIAVAAFDSSELMVFLGHGDGSFDQGTTLLIRSRRVRSADFDADGHLDLVCTGRSSSIFIYHGLGDGSFDRPRQLENAGVYPLSLATGDLNLDGRPDLLLGAYTTHVIVLLNQGLGVFFDTGLYRPPGGYYKALALGDVNNDGILDMAAAADNPASFVILLGHGDGTFSAPVSWTMWSFIRSIHIIDLDGDGNRDLLVGLQHLGGGGFNIRLGNGDGTFGELIVYDENEYVEDCAVGDLNGDDLPDIILVDAADNQVIVYLGRGNATFERLDSILVGENPGHADLGDLDRDGNLDLAVSNRDSGSVSILLGNGDGSFAPPAHYGADYVSGDIVLDDLTGDGKLDVAVTGSGVKIFPGRGDGTLRQPLWYEAGYGPTALAVGDVNEDGRGDVVLGDGVKKAVTLLLGGQMRSPIDYLAQYHASGIELGDLNLDTHLDVVLCTWGGLHVMLNNARRFSTVTTDLTCVPAAGTIPFASRIQCRISNHWHGKRRMHASLEAQLANGTLFQNWRSANMVLDDIETRSFSWIQTFPALPGLVGENVFRLTASDISQAPFNQPPYPASGWTGSDDCTVEGIASMK